MTRGAAIIGFLFNAVGTYLAGQVLWRGWFDNADGQPLWPWWHRRQLWFRRVILRRHKRVHSVGSSISTRWNVRANAGAVVTRRIPAEDASVEEQIAYLRREVDTLHDFLGMHRTALEDRINEADRRIAAVANEARAATAEVDRQRRRSVAESIPRQLLGLVLIGIGTLIGVVPAVLGWK